MNQDTFYQVACEGILGLRTNVNGFGWSFNQCAATDTEVEYQACQVKLGLYLLRDAEMESGFPARGRATQYSHFQGSAEEDEVFYRRSFSGSRHFLLRAVGLVNRESLIYANPRYLRYVRLRLMNLHSLNFLLTDVAALQLLRRGLAAIHCSAFVKGDRTVVIFAPSNTGKTLTVMRACAEPGVCFVSEDMAITDGAMVYGVPWTSTFLHYSEVDRSVRSRLAKSLARVFPPVALMSLVKPTRVTSILGPDGICGKSRATHVIVLERGDDEVSFGRRDEVLRKVLNLNRCEYNYVRSPLLMAYEFLNPALDIDKAYQMERTILRQLVDGVEECLIVRARNPVEFAPTIMRAVWG